MRSDPTKLKSVRELSRPDILLSVARMPESSGLFVGSSDANVYELDPAAEKIEPQAFAGHSSYVGGVAVCGGKLVSGGWDGKLIWWDLESRTAVTTVVDAHKKWIRGVEASPDGKHVASVGDDMVCRVWNAENGQIVHELRGHELQTPHHYPSMLFACAFSPDSQHLATVDKTGRIIVWEVASGKQAATMEAAEMYTWDPRQRRHSIGGPRSLAFSPDGATLAVGGMGQVGNIDHLEGKARLEWFDWRKGERTWEHQDDQFKGLIERLVWHPENQWLLAAGGDHGGFLMFFDVAQKSVLKSEKAPTHVHGVVLNEAYDTLYSAGYSKLVVWELKGETPEEGKPPEPEEDES